MDPTNAVVLVTGASSGIGAATARAASHAGARVVLLARREHRIRELATELGGEALAISCDVTDRAQVEAAVRAAINTYGRIDVLINSAGQGLQARTEELDPADLRAVLELNLVAVLVTMQAVLPTMQAQGSGTVVNISSGITFADLPGSAGYSASKAALEKLTSIAREELADAGIAVSLMIPWITSTEFSTSVLGDVAGAQELEAGSGFEPDTPEDVAAAILDLIRSGASRADLVPVEAGGTLRS